jgi:beta-1,4-mannosyltransferase
MDAATGALVSVAVLIAVAVVALVMVLRQRRDDVGVCVVVLGDLGRSPRMQNHCVELLRCGRRVAAVAYGGSALVDELRIGAGFCFVELPQPWSLKSA